MSSVKNIGSIRTFKDLRVWQDGVELVRDAYKLCALLPKDEQYGLGSQIKRAAVSIPANIAEGHARRSRAEYRQGIYIAIGSLAELETHLLIVRELALVNHDLSSGLLARVDRLRAMLLTLGHKL